MTQSPDEASPRRWPRFLSSPNLGGWLTITNCGLWAIVAFAGQFGIGPLAYAAWVAWWPIAWFWYLPRLGGLPSVSEVVFQCVIVGPNALLWGYGIAWVVRAIQRRNQAIRDRPGFEVIFPEAPQEPRDEEHRVP